MKVDARFLNLLSAMFASQRALTDVRPAQIKSTVAGIFLVLSLSLLIPCSAVAQMKTNDQSGSKAFDPASQKVEQPSQARPDDLNHGVGPGTSEPPFKAHHLTFHRKPALLQSLLLLSVQRGVDIMTERDTRVNLRGPFLKDYFRSVANTHGWRDGDSFKTNYLAHPFQGAVTGFIEIENDPKGMYKKFEWTRSYWKSRLRAMGWATAYSTNFEIGLGISEAMIGNVGLPAQYRAPGSKPRPANGGMGFVDMVITPTVGTGFLVGEDILDRYVIAKIENHTSNTLLQVSMRIILNPMRSSANLLRAEKPWHRDSRGRSLIEAAVWSGAVNK